jgi:nitroimidazol reductase NimA-like FMN-containing flavoprotein (pyridoxamine 5'-phosphate oxidase superfamily)
MGMEMQRDWYQAGFVALGDEECLELLGQESFGRVGVTLGSIPVVLPVNYHFADGAIHFRTGEGTKLKAAAQNTVVAFQVDHIDPIYHAGWSVLAVGAARLLDDSTDASWASHLPLRAWAPGVRDHFVRIVPEFISGRRILPGHDESMPWP